MPWAIIKSILARLFPAAFKRKLARTMTMPATVSITPSHGNGRPGAKQVPYITFEAIVGRNSTFHMLTSEQMDEIGGVEYRALNALLWIVPIVCSFISVLLLTHLEISFLVSFLDSTSLIRDHCYIHLPAPVATCFPE